MVKSEYVPLEALLKKTDGSIFKLVIAAAKRSLEIAEGIKPLVEASKDEKPIEIVFREIAEGKVFYKKKPLKTNSEEKN